MRAQRIAAERDSSETHRGPVVHALTNRPPLRERAPLPSVRELPMNDLRTTSSIASLVASFARHATNASLVRAEFHVRAVLVTLVLVTSSFLCGQARAAGDAAAGKTVFANQCASCHTTEVGKKGFGPSLAAVLGRKAGGLAGFTYSPAMAQAGLTWDDKTLDEFLTSSTTKVPGTSMPVALPNPADRANVIAYLGTLGRASAAAPSAPAASAPA